MKILCTGGAGYVGSACLRYLLRHGHDAIAFDDLSESNRHSVPDADRRLIVGDITDREQLDAAFAAHRFDAVMHFAAVASVPDSIRDPATYWRINLLGTKTLLDAMLAHGVDNLIFSSTAAVYTITDEMPLGEDAPKAPATPYGSTKLACETMIEEYRVAYGLGYTAMRYFNASGADEDGEFGEDRRAESHLIPLTLFTAVGRRETLFVYGTDWPTRDGTCVRDFVHVDDIAQAHVRAMETNRPGAGRTYNIGSNEGTTVREVVAACEAAAGKPIPVEHGPPRPGDPAVLVASSDKLVRELDWTPRFTTIDAIVETAYRWHTRYPGGYADKVGTPATPPAKDTAF